MICVRVEATAALDRIRAGAEVLGEGGSGRERRVEEQLAASCGAELGDRPGFSPGLVSQARRALAARARPRPPTRAGKSTPSAGKFLTLFPTISRTNCQAPNQFYLKPIKPFEFAACFYH